MIDQDEKLLNKVYKITRELSIDENLLLKNIIKFILFRFTNQNILSEIRIMKETSQNKYIIIILLVFLQLQNFTKIIFR